MNIDELTIQEKIGQMIMVGMDTNYITDRIKTLITKYKIGGIILYRKNFNTYQDMLKLIKELKDLNKENKIPLFIAIDQEGGRVNRMPKELLNLPSANTIATVGGQEYVKKSSQITGEILKKSGFNLDFAPVLDIKRFDDKHPIGDRCYGNNKDDVAKYGVLAMQELQKSGIISVIKHFPGHGVTKVDSHRFLPISKRSMKQIEKEDLYPFLQAIKNNADALLVGHIVIKEITGVYPASLSRKFIIEYIRRKYKFKGVIFTDDLKMKAIKFLYGANFAIEKAFQAGNDIIVFRFNQKEEKRAIERITKMVEYNKLKIGRINRSVKRVLELKEKYKISDKEKIVGVDIQKINRKIQEVRDKCL